MHLQRRPIEALHEEIMMNPSLERCCRTSRIGTNVKTALISLQQVVLIVKNKIGNFISHFAGKSKYIPNLLWNRVTACFARRSTMRIYTWWSCRTAFRNYRRIDYAPVSLWHSLPRHLHTSRRPRDSLISQNKKHCAVRHDLQLSK